MKIKIDILNKQIDLFVRDFFIDNDDQFEGNNLSLRNYLIERLNNLKNDSKVNLSHKEFKQSFINICDKYNITEKISNDRDEAIQTIGDLIDNQFTINNDFIEKIEDHFKESIKRSRDINFLYKKNWFDEKSENTNSIIRMLKVNKEVDIKEMVGVINTFIENTKTDELETQINGIIRQINEKSIAFKPFKNQGGKIKYLKSNAGEFDFFMYDRKSNAYSICMSTKSQTTKIEGSSPIRHTLAMYYIIIKANENSRRLGIQSLTESESILEIENQIEKMDDFRSYNINNSPKEKESRSDRIKRNIKSITRNTDLIIDEFVKMGILDESVIRESSENKKHTSYSIDENSLKMIESYIESKGIKANVYYFGDVISSANRENTYDSEYSNEEIRAAANVFAYSNVGSDGFNGVNLSPSASIRFCKSLKMRFNTSTDSNSNCVDLIKLNNESVDIIGRVIKKTTQFEKTEDILHLYDRNSKSRENKDVIENITNIESVLIDLIQEGVEKGVEPNTSYLYAMSTFNVTPTVSLDKFISNMQKKYSIINESIVKSGYDKLKILSNKINLINERHKIEEETFKSAIMVTFEDQLESIDQKYLDKEINKSEMELQIKHIEDKVDEMYESFKNKKDNNSSMKIVNSVY